MYVIVEINGQQFKAEEGKKLFVHHIQNAENGATVEFEKVLLVDNNGAVTVHSEHALCPQLATLTHLLCLTLKLLSFSQLFSLLIF